MEVRAPKGQYRVIGLDPVDTLTWPSGPLCNDNGEILHEAGCYREQLKRIHELEEQRPGRAQDERPKT